MEDFKDLIQQLSSNLHDTDAFHSIKKLMEGLKDTKKRREFLGPKLTKDPITFSSVKAMWDEETQKKNKFYFLQGDIISSLSVLEVGKARSSQKHKLWIVKSSDCDIARVEPYAEVSPIFPIYGKKNTSEELKSKAQSSWNFRSDRNFPLPQLFNGDEENGVSGYVVDLTIPGFVNREDFPLITPIKSLAPTGWVLFKNTLHRRYTRAVNLEEAFQIHM